MSSPLLPSIRIVLFSVLAPGAIQKLIDKLESLNQQVLLLVISPGTRHHSLDHCPQIVGSIQWRLDVLVSSHMQRLPDILRDIAPDLIFVAGFPRKLPPAILQLPRMGCVNWHPSLLPCYRGPEPIFWQMINGETHTGVTFHRMDADIDTGPILVQRAMSIEPEDNISSFFEKALALTLASIPDVLQTVAAGAPGIPQPARAASYAPHVTEAERWLDWTRPATRLRNQVQTWYGLNGALAKIEGRNALIRRARVIDAGSDGIAAVPGSLLACSSEGIVIQTGQDALLLQEYSYETA